MKDRTGYEIRVGSHVKAPEGTPGFTPQRPGGLVERIEADCLWLRTPRGMRVIRPAGCEVVRMSDKATNRPGWARQIALARTYDQKPVTRRGAIR